MLIPLSPLSFMASLMARIYSSHMSFLLNTFKISLLTSGRSPLQETLAASLLQRSPQNLSHLKFKPSLYLWKREFPQKTSVKSMKKYM